MKSVSVPKIVLCLLFVVCLLLPCTACNEPIYHFCIINRTGKVLSELRMCGCGADKTGSDLLRKNLADQDSVDVSVAAATEDTTHGFTLEAVDASGDTLGTVTGIAASEGDQILLYMDGDTLCAAVNLLYEQAAVSIPEQVSNPENKGIQSVEEIVGVWRNITDTRCHVDISADGTWEYYEGSGLTATGTLKYDESIGGMYEWQEEEYDLVYMKGRYLSFSSFGTFAKTEADNPES